MPETNLLGQAACTVALTNCAKDPKHNAHGEVFLLARARTEYAPVLRTKLVAVNKVIPNYGGLLKGLTSKVNVVEYGLSKNFWNQSMSMVVIQFPSLDCATRWSESDPVFRCKDFPTTAHRIEMIVVPLLHMPPPGFKTFQITSFMVSDDDIEKFQREYVDKAATFFHKHKMCYSVAMTNTVKNLRWGWVAPNNKEYISVLMFPDEETMWAVTKNAEYEALKEALKKMTVSTTMWFTVE